MNSEKASSKKIVSQKEYLKKYLSNTKTKTKKKPIKRANVKVIDDNDLTSHHTEENFDLETGEDAPVIAAVIDERPKTIQRLEAYKTSDRWAPVPQVNDAISENSSHKRNQRDPNEENHIYDDTESRHDSPTVEPRSITDCGEKYKKHSTSRINDASNSKDKRSGKLQNHSYRESSAVREEAHLKNTNDSNSLNTKKHRRHDTIFTEKKSRHQNRKNSSDESLSPQRKKHSGEDEKLKSGKLVKDRHSRRQSPSLDRKKSKDLIRNRHTYSSDESLSPQQMKYYKEDKKLKSEKVNKDRCSPRESHSPDTSKSKDRKRNNNAYSSDDSVSPRRTKNLKDYEESNSKKFNKDKYSHEEQHSPNRSKSRNQRKDHDALPAKKKRSKYSSDSSPSPDRRLSDKNKKLGKHLSNRVSREGLVETKKRDDKTRDYSSAKKKRDKSSSDRSLSPSHESRRKKKTHENSSDFSPSHDSNMTRKKKKNRHSSPRKKVSKRSSSSTSSSSHSSNQNIDGKNKCLIDKREKHREKKSDFGVSPERNRDYSKKKTEKNSSSLSITKKSEKYSSDRNSSRSKDEKITPVETVKSKYSSSSSKNKSERHDRKTNVENDENKEKPTAEQYYQWGKGLKQIEDENEKLAYALHEMSKPLARYADDEDLDKHLRNMERDGDPLAIIKRNLNDDSSADGAKPKYKGTYPQNRFGIPPGHKWDGVDRSNGYEVKWLGKAKAKEAVEEEAYKWSTEDM